LNTRLRKLDSENSPYACLLLAFAGIPLTHIGVHRMGWDSRITEILDKNEILYAVGQGALGIETREDDGITNEVVKVLQHFPTRVRCEAERAFMKALEGGCSVPLGVFTSFEDGILSLIGSVTSLDGQEQLRHEATVKVSGDEDEQIKSAHRLGNQVADVLKSQGAVEMLVAIRQQSAI
jgi:hydroxymethylbilane synthase